MSNSTTVTGYQVVAGVVRERTLYATRKDAAKHVKDAKPSAAVEGFCVRWGSVVPVVSRVVRGKWRHQQVGKEGYHWDSYNPPYVTRAEACAVVLADLRDSLKRKQKEVRTLEKQIVKGVK